MKKVIGIIGPLASGKDSVAEYLRDRYKIPTYQISSELKELAQENGVPINRDDLISYSRELVLIHGDGYLAERIVEKSKEDIIVIAGMRQLGQIEYLKENTSLVLIGIDASPETRFQRVGVRAKKGDPITLEEFIRIEQKDDGESVQKVSDCMKLADYTIQNEGTKEELYKEIDRVVNISEK